MSEATLEAVTFDAAGTLFRVAEPVEETYARGLTRRGFPASTAVVAKRFRTAFAGAPPLAFPGRDARARDVEERAWWRRIVDAAIDPARALPEPTRGEIFEELYAHYAAGAAWVLDRDAVSVLDSLRARGLRLGVVSNFDSRLSGILAELGVAARFDVIVASAMAPAAKPAPAIFAHALGCLGTAAGRTLHVGDDRRCDLEGARAAGLRALLLDREALRGDDTIAELRDVLDRIG